MMLMAHACAHEMSPGSRCRSPSSFYASGKAWCRAHKPAGAIRWVEHLRQQKAAQEATEAMAPERRCPNCGEALDVRRCKQVCACGYFDDCSIGPA